MKKRHRLVRGFQNGKKDQEEERLRIGYPKSQKLAERAAVSIQNPAHSLARFDRFAPRISNPSQTSPAARGEPRLRLLRRLLRHEQLPRLRGHRPRQALGNPPSPSLPRSAPEGFGSTPPSRLPPWIRQDRGGPGSSASDF